MYMTRLEMDRTKRATMLALSSPNMLHGAVESSFPGERKRRLWRIDELYGRCYLLVVSEDAPQMAAAAAQFAPEGASWQTRSYDAFLAKIRPGSQWHFRIVANPTVSTSRGEGQRGKITPHVSVRWQKQWLMDRASGHGFSLEENGFQILRRGVVSFGHGPAHQRVTLNTCEYEGRLTVTDVSLFRQTLTRGIGRGKAYGLGMLTIASELPPTKEASHE